MAFSNQARLSNPSDGRPSLRSVDDSTIHIEPGQPNSKGFLGVSWTGRCDAVETNQVFYFWTNPFTSVDPCSARVDLACYAPGSILVLHTLISCMP